MAQNDGVVYSQLRQLEIPNWLAVDIPLEVQPVLSSLCSTVLHRVHAYIDIMEPSVSEIAVFYGGR